MQKTLYTVISWRLSILNYLEPHGLSYSFAVKQNSCNQKAYLWSVLSCLVVNGVFYSILICRIVFQFDVRTESTKPIMQQNKTNDSSQVIIIGRMETSLGWGGGGGRRFLSRVKRHRQISFRGWLPLSGPGWISWFSRVPLTFIHCRGCTFRTICNSSHQ